jgi:hypothetical protein
VEATPHQRLERLLREKNIPIGLLITDEQQLRLVHAPRGETSGHSSPHPLLLRRGWQFLPMPGGLETVALAYRVCSTIALEPAVFAA